GPFPSVGPRQSEWCRGDRKRETTPSRDHRADYPLAYPDRVLAQARLRHIAGRAGRFLATPLGLLCLFALGLILRLVVAPNAGLQFDLDYFRTWTVRLTVLGPSHFYDSGFPADPPGYPLVLLGLSKINSLLG